MGDWLANFSSAFAVRKMLTAKIIKQRECDRIFSFPELGAQVPFGWRLGG
jgi:hypothetical protein